MRSALGPLLLILSLSAAPGCALIDGLSGGPDSDSDRPDDGGVDDPPIGQAVLAAWAECMSRDDWLEAQMGLWSDKPTSEVLCSGCHDNGQFGIFIHPDSLVMFEMNRVEPFISGFFTVRFSGGNAGEVVPAFEKLMSMGSGGPADSHPLYDTDLAADPAFQALNVFYAGTRSRLESGSCDFGNFVGR